MQQYFFMNKVIDRLNQGKFFRDITATIIRIFAILSVVGGFGLLISILGKIFDMGGAAILGGLIFVIFLVVLLYMITHVMFIRAGHIKSLPDGDYTILPIMSIAFKMYGEILASCLVSIAIGGGVFIWFAGWKAAMLLSDLAPLMVAGGHETAFVGGLVFMISGLIYGFFFLFLFYLLAEMTIVLVDIARNTKKVTADLPVQATQVSLNTYVSEK